MSDLVSLPLQLNMSFDGERDILRKLDDDFERVLLTTLLLHTEGHKQEAAKRLGWGRNTLTR